MWSFISLSVHSYITAYSLGQAITVMFFSTSYLIYIFGSLRAAKIIHSTLMSSVLGTTLRHANFASLHCSETQQPNRWLDMTPASRIITRCTQDIQASTSASRITCHFTDTENVSAVVDNQIVDYFFWWLEHSGTMATRLGAVVLMSPLMLIPGSTIFVLGALCGYLYINAQLSAKREMSLAQAPVLGHFGAAIAGLGPWILSCPSY